MSFFPLVFPFTFEDTSVPSEQVVVRRETRTITVEPDPRVIVVPADNRTITIGIP